MIIHRGGDRHRRTFIPMRLSWMP